jgi:polyisoprenoid-binding protein YceI
MQAPSGQLTTPALQVLLTNGSLTGEWALDPGASSIRLTSKSMGLFRVTGEFREVEGHGTVSPDGQVEGQLTVAAASVDTKNARRDEHLRSADFFDTDSNPDITFTVDGIRPAGHGVAVRGWLTVRGHTRPLSFEATASGQADGEIWLDAEVPVNRADFDLTWNLLGMVSLYNVIAVHAVFTR